MPFGSAVNTLNGIAVDNSTVYDSSSRTASITGDYGIIGSNNEITHIDTQTIVNETNNTVYNPSTGESDSFTSYEYDYSTRTYSLTMTGGTTTTVTYGDEYITYDNGTTSTNIYYLIEQPQQMPDTPVAHTHNYTDSITRQPTCTLDGVRTYTCSECGDTYTQSISALGHDWRVKTEVLTEYDDNGDIVTQGYTIYKCSRCGEERRSDDGTPPASGGGDDNSLSTIDSEGIQQLRDKLSTFFSEFPAMFGDLTNFLQEGFAYIPEDIMNMITFAVGLSVVMGIFKFFWR